MISWYVKAFKRSVTDLTKHPFLVAMSTITLTLTSLLVSLLLLFMVNLNAELLHIKGRLAFQIYWTADTDMEVVHSQWTAFEKMPHFSKQRTFTPAEALQELGKSLKAGEGELLSLAGKNPLPPTALLYFSPPPEQDIEAFSQKILTTLKKQQGVKSVHFSQVQLGLAKAWLDFSQKILWPLLLLLAVGAGFMVVSTLRLILLFRASELEILKLVGAGYWYIQLPLLWAGGLLGLTSALLGLGLLKLVHVNLADLLNTPPLNIHLVFLPPAYAFGLILGMTLSGILASFVAAKDAH